ncbi:MAG: SGNH/GDSL hydrolase family protein [Paracoccaceae bacterium]
MPVVLCYGDSNTHGSVPNDGTGPWLRHDRRTRWPGRMADLLGPGWHVIEEGLPGRTTCHDSPFDGPHKNGLRLIGATLESHAPVDLVILMLGTNDLKALYSATAFDIAKGVRMLAQRVLASQAGPGFAPPRLLLVAPAPITEIGAAGEQLAGGAAKSRALAGRLAALAQEIGADFLDAGAVVAVSDIDGVHLCSSAHERLGEALADRLREMEPGFLRLKTGVQPGRMQ